MTGLFLCLLQYEGRRSASPLGLSKNPQVQVLGFNYIPMQLVAPRAVTIAVAILAIICTMNLMVSLFVIPEPLSSRIGARWRLLMRSYYLP